MCYLVEAVQGLVQVGVHASRRFVGDLDGVLQYALWDDVAFGGGGRLGADEHPEVLVTSLCMLLQKFLQSAQPASHQVDILQEQETEPASVGLKRKIARYCSIRE